MSAPIELFQAMRQALHASFARRADTLFNLLDSLSGRQNAQSPVELTLESPFERRYSSLYDALANFFVASDPAKAGAERLASAVERVKILLSALSKPKRPFWLTGIDATSTLRPYADKLRERCVVYQPNPAPGNKPIGVGHSYSVLALLPERAAHDPPWLLPLLCTRIPIAKTANQVAAAQMMTLLGDADLPFGIDLTVNVADSAYSKAAYLSPVGAYDNHVEVARVAANRVFYRLVPAAVETAGAGHPTWYGAAFDLKHAATWGTRDEEATVVWETHAGRKLTVRLQRWHDLLMRGKQGAPMHQRPLDLIHCQVFDAQGKPVFKKSLWLLVLGKRRREVSLVAAYEAYRQRYDMEHFFRFGKNKLLLDRLQTPEVTHEESWWELVCLAYAQLALAAPLAAVLPRPWEVYLPQWQERPLPGPAQVQRDFPRIIRAFGSLARSPKPRGISPGRQKGASPGVRPRQPVVFKSRAPPKAAA
jgi:hypothetical protein